jgi:hypothetical protein
VVEDESHHGVELVRKGERLVRAGAAVGRQRGCCGRGRVRALPACSVQCLSRVQLMCGRSYPCQTNSDTLRQNALHMHRSDDPERKLHEREDN